MKTLSADQYAVFLAGLQSMAPRDSGIFILLLQCGMRVGEICSLNIADVCLSGRVFHTIGIRNGHSKVKSLRYVPLSPAAVDILTKYLNWSKLNRPGACPSDPLFVSLVHQKRLLPRDIQRLSIRYTVDLLGEKFHPHSFRHTFATRLLKVSNIRVVQQLLGHAALSSTMVYTHPSDDDRRAAVLSAF